MSWTVYLRDDQLAFAEAEVAAGRYASVIDVVIAGLQLLKDQYEAAETTASGTAERPRQR